MTMTCSWTAIQRLLKFWIFVHELNFPCSLSKKNMFQVRAERNKAVEESRQVMIKSVTHLHTQLCICILFGSKFVFAFVYIHKCICNCICVYIFVRNSICITRKCNNCSHCSHCRHCSHCSHCSHCT